MCSFCGRAFRQRSQQIGHESTHLSHFATSNSRTTPSSSSTTSSASASAKGGESEQPTQTSASSSSAQQQRQPPQSMIHPTPPTPSPEQQQHQLNMAAAVMMQQHQNEITSLLALHEFGAPHHQNSNGGVGGALHSTFAPQQSAAEATANGMRMLSHIAS
uniref:C2H2-type domain-containing protein n=1 Tax=Caenorhabditis japonica TaxID=281687 RepID=A0A8R1DYG4_CAEJA